MNRQNAALFLAEALGTFGLVFAGCGAIMIDVISHGQLSHVGVSLVFGLIIMAMIAAFGHISGGHFNPAVTLGFVVSGHVPPQKIVLYWSAQFFGACAAAATLRMLLGTSANLGATIPAGPGGAWQSFGLEFFLTFLLMLVIMAVATDPRANGSIAAMAIGATIALEALFGGPISGASMNPVRSLAPALFSMSWQDQWVYLLAPPLGAMLAAVIYQTFLSPVSLAKSTTKLDENISA